MENKKRAIILDMDETLEHGISQAGYGVGNDASMVLRPNLDELILKLQEAKKQGIDIILCTTAREKWVERFLGLKPEFKEIFNKIFTRDNQEQWKNCNKETNPLEYEAKQQNCNFENSKPVTTFGYDSVLFIDDNKKEAYCLKELFKITQNKLEKDVTYFSGFRFHIGDYDLFRMLEYKKLASEKIEIKQKLEQYLEFERKEPGCHIICSVIDEFINKSFMPGLTLMDDKYSEEYNLFVNQRNTLNKELKDLVNDTKKQLLKYSESELSELSETLKAYLSTDKKFPYEGIETEQLSDNKRELLNGLVQKAIDVQISLKEEQKLNEKKQLQQQKELE